MRIFHSDKDGCNAFLLYLKVPKVGASVPEPTPSMGARAKWNQYPMSTGLSQRLEGKLVV